MSIQSGSATSISIVPSIPAGRVYRDRAKRIAGRFAFRENLQAIWARPTEMQDDDVRHWLSPVKSFET
jgi:hypothetical protein